MTEKYRVEKFRVVYAAHTKPKEMGWIITKSHEVEGLGTTYIQAEEKLKIFATKREAEGYLHSYILKDTAECKFIKEYEKRKLMK